MTAKNISGHCQLSPEEQNHSWLRTTMIEDKLDWGGGMRSDFWGFFFFFLPRNKVIKMYVAVVQSLSSVWLWDSMECSPPGSSVHGISQARILEWVAMSSSRGYSPPRDQTCVSCIGRRILYHWATREAIKIYALVLKRAMKSYQGHKRRSIHD